MKPKFSVLGFLGLDGFLLLHQGLFPHGMDMADQDPHSIQNT